MSRILNHVWSPVARERHGENYTVTDECFRCKMKRQRSREGERFNTVYLTGSGSVRKAPMCPGPSAYSVPLKRHV